MKYYGKISDSKDLVTKEYADGKVSSTTSILKGDGTGKAVAASTQNATLLGIDTVPTSGSSNLITSGAVATAVSAVPAPVVLDINVWGAGPSVSTNMSVEKTPFHSESQSGKYNYYVYDERLVTLCFDGGGYVCTTGTAALTVNLSQGQGWYASEYATFNVTKTGKSQPYGTLTFSVSGTGTLQYTVYIDYDLPYGGDSTLIQVFRMKTKVFDIYYGDPVVNIEFECLENMRG